MRAVHVLCHDLLFCPSGKKDIVTLNLYILIRLENIVLQIAIQNEGRENKRHVLYKNDELFKLRIRRK